MLTVPQQAQAALVYAKDTLAKDGVKLDKAFVDRLNWHFVTIFGIFTELYGYRNDALDQLIDLIKDCAKSWDERPEDMKAIDVEREENPEWFTSNNMVGGVCYVSLKTFSCIYDPPVDPN